MWEDYECVLCILWRLKATLCIESCPVSLSCMCVSGVPVRDLYLILDSYLII